MKVAVRYFTRTGNTKKLADAIAQTVGVEAFDVSCPLEEDVDILFLGSSVYAAGVDNEIKKFISSIDVKVGKVYNFSTAAILTSTYSQVKKLLEDKDIQMAEENFACKGQFKFMHKNKPDSNDLKNACDFARKVMED